MHKAGMHLPNRPFHDGEWQRIQTLGLHDYVDLHLFRERWRDMKRDQPSANIHARVFAGGSLDDPVREAEELVRLVHEQGDVVATWRYRNEPNLPAEGPGITPALWRDWLAAFGAAAKQAVPHARIYAPALSPGTPDWLEWLDATVEAAHAGGFDGLDVHAYGNLDEVRHVLDQHDARWSGPKLITETNFGAGRADEGLGRHNFIKRYADQFPSIVQLVDERGYDAICLFIWQWNSRDMRLPVTVDVKDSPIETMLLDHRPRPRRGRNR